MKHPTKIKSIHSNPYLLVIVLLLFGFLGIYSGKEIFTKRYFDGGALGLSLFFFAFALIALYYLINRKAFELSSKKIILKTRFSRKVFPASKIQGFKEEVYKEKHQSGTRLVFKMDNKFLTIDSNSYINFHKMLEFTKQHFKELDDQEFQQYELLKNLPLRITLLVGAILFFGFFIDIRFDEVDDLDKDLQFTEMTLASTPVIKSSGSKRYNQYIQIYTTEYPEFEFKISGYQYQACNTNLTTELQAGDKIMVGLKSDEFRSKIENLDPPSFRMKHFHWDRIEIYQLQHEGDEYIDANLAKRRMKDNQKWSWLFLAMGLISIVIAIVLGKSNNKNILPPS